MIQGSHVKSLLVILLVGTLCPSILAQRPPLRTPPNQFGPPPVYDLFQQRRGILPNYYQYYLPQQRLQQNLRMQDYQLQRQGNAIQSLRNQWLAPEQSGAALNPTGSGSSYMNYSHFYPGLGNARR